MQPASKLFKSWIVAKSIEPWHTDVKSVSLKLVLRPSEQIKSGIFLADCTE